MIPNLPGFQWLYSLTNHEKRMPDKYSTTTFSTSRYVHLLRMFDNPHLITIPTVQILGTDGKGSTLAFLEEILIQSGKRVCSFISPHLVNTEERCRMQGQSIATPELESLLLEVRNKAETLEGITFFEVLNVAFWLWVQKNQPDYVLLETGLGGRLDTTTICQPSLKILTRLDRDHIHLLGKTMTSIAFEKLAAMVPGCPVVITPQSNFLRPEIANYLCQHQIPALWVEDLYHPQILQRTPDSWSLKVNSETYELGLLGDHQVGNFLAALLATENLLGHPPPLSNARMHPNWNCRCQIMHTPQGCFILDGSHTAQGGQALRKVIDVLYPAKPRTFFCTFTTERFPWCYLRGLVRPVDELFLVQTHHPRLWKTIALKSELIRQGWLEYDLPELQLISSDQIFSIIDEESLKICCGSFYWAGAMLELIQANRVHSERTA